MKKFINHVDHVAWLSRPENLDANVAQLEKLTGASLTRFSRADMGFTMCISWEAGLEVVAPHEERTDFNQWLWSELEKKGEGVTSVVFGVKNLELVYSVNGGEELELYRGASDKATVQGRSMRVRLEVFADGTIVEKRLRLPLGKDMMLLSLPSLLAGSEPALVPFVPAAASAPRSPSRKSTPEPRVGAVRPLFHR